MKTCQECSSEQMNYDAERAEWWCDDCGDVIEDHLTTVMTGPVAPEINGSVTTRNPYHRDVTGSSFTLNTKEDWAQIQSANSEQRRLLNAMQREQRWSRPSQVSHYASRVWDLVEEVYGEQLANQLYDDRVLDDLLRPLERRIGAHMRAVLDAAERHGVVLKQPSGAVARSLIEGQTEQEREASKVPVRAKDAIFAAAVLIVYGELYPNAPRDMRRVHHDLMARSGLDGRRAQDVLKLSIKEFKRHLRDLASIGAFSQRDDSSHAARLARLQADEDGWFGTLDAFVHAQPALARYATDILHDTASRLEAMRESIAEGDNQHPSPFSGINGPKRLGLAAMAAMKARGIDRGMPKPLGLALGLAESTLSTLWNRLQKLDDPRMSLLDAGYAPPHRDVVQHANMPQAAPPASSASLAPTAAWEDADA